MLKLGGAQSEETDSKHSVLGQPSSVWCVTCHGNLACIFWIYLLFGYLYRVGRVCKQCVYSRMGVLCYLSGFAGLSVVSDDLHSLCDNKKAEEKVLVNYLLTNLLSNVKIILPKR